MLFYEIKNKKEAANQANRLSEDIGSINDSVSTVQSNVGQVSRAIDQVKNEIPEDLTDDIGLLSSMLAATSKALEQVKNEIPEDLTDAVGNISSRLNAVSLKANTIDQLEGSINDVIQSAQIFSADSQAKENKINSIRAQIVSGIDDIKMEIDQLGFNIQRANMLRDLQGAAMSGNLHLYSTVADAYVSATELNAAAVGTFGIELLVELVKEIEANEDVFRQTHTWFNGAPFVSGEVICTDQSIGALDVKSADYHDLVPVADHGMVRMWIPFDTDSGNEKVWQSGDKYTITVQVSADDKLLGYMVPGFVITYNIVE